MGIVRLSVISPVDRTGKHFLYAWKGEWFLWDNYLYTCVVSMGSLLHWRRMRILLDRDVTRGRRNVSKGKSERVLFWEDFKSRVWTSGCCMSKIEIWSRPFSKHSQVFISKNSKFVRWLTLGFSSTNYLSMLILANTCFLLFVSKIRVARADCPCPFSSILALGIRYGGTLKPLLLVRINDVSLLHFPDNFDWVRDAILNCMFKKFSACWGLAHGSSSCIHLEG